MDSRRHHAMAGGALEGTRLNAAAERSGSVSGRSASWTRSSIRRSRSTRLALSAMSMARALRLGEPSGEKSERVAALARELLKPAAGTVPRGHPLRNLGKALGQPRMAASALPVSAEIGLKDRAWCGGWRSSAAVSVSVESATVSCGGSSPRSVSTPSNLIGASVATPTPSRSTRLPTRSCPDRNGCPSP